MKIIFMGTPDFALKSLEGLVESKQEISLVVTQPDRPKGRGLGEVSSPVKTFALDKGIPVITPLKIKSELFFDKLASLKPDLIVVSAYGRILPRKILDLPSLYPINVHASLLPSLRGAAPINWAIIRGEKRTGITVMKMSEGMDEGDIMFQREVGIGPDDNASLLHDRLASLGKEMVVEAVLRIKSGKASFVPQDHSKATYAPILKKGDGLIGWSLPREKLHDFVRGMTPWPGAYSFIHGRMVKIHRTSIADPTGPGAQGGQAPGTIVSVKGQSIEIMTGHGLLAIKELQLESKKRMSSAEFTKSGFLKQGDKFEDSKEQG